MQAPLRQRHAAACVSDSRGAGASQRLCLVSTLGLASCVVWYVDLLQAEWGSGVGDGGGRDCTKGPVGAIFLVVCLRALMYA